MLHLDGESLTIEDVVEVARNHMRVGFLSSEVKKRMEASHFWVERSVWEGGKIIYGVNTGFGPLATTQIAPEQARRLSRNLILNCAAGVGNPLNVDIVRAMMLIRANSLIKGYSGVRPLIVETMIKMLNKGVTPFIPEKGSLGASGDLAPLAHMAAVFTRDPDGSENDFSGKAIYQGELMEGSEALKRAGIPPVVLGPKEGLAITNGTTFMAAAGCLGVTDAQNLVRHAELTAALSYEALLGNTEALNPDLHRINGQPGQEIVAANINAFINGSGMVNTDVNKVQDAYSLRCTPQVLGPIRDTLLFLRDRFIGAINAVSDNPLIFMDLSGESGEVVSGGNFHGAGPAMWLDFLSIAIAEAGNISERRIFRMLTPELNSGLPMMLVRTHGVDSGLMVPQYTAAALVSDNKTLAHPDSVDSIPSSANQEDHVSMGANAARHMLEIIQNVHYILAIEMLTAAQAVDLRPNGPSNLGKGTSELYKLIRKDVSFLDHDRQTASDIEKLAELIKSGVIIKEIRRKLGDGYTL